MENRNEDEFYSLVNSVRNLQRARRIATFVSASSLVALIAAVVGVVALFSQAHTVLYVCAAITLADSLVQVFLGQQNNLGTEIMMIAIGGICTLFGFNFWRAASAALCIETALLTLLSLPILLQNFRK